MTRDHRHVFLALACSVTATSAATLHAGQDDTRDAMPRPNILWISCEDTSPHLGCYGDDFAVTPNIDRLAAEGVRYTSAFAYTGVCAPSRSCLITGVYPLRLGSEHMRSTTRRPDHIRCFTEFLRDAGYYCSNNSKEDYNFATPKNAWDDSGKQAHWRGRRSGQPFFSVFNFTVCHQSQVFCSEKKYQQNTLRLTANQRHDPDRVGIPPIHPDTPEFRKEWARHYDNVTAMDYQVGDVLAELEQDGLTQDTIVFFFSDHGTGMPAIKMFAWGPSLQVPLIVRTPQAWQPLAPGPAGSATDRLVSFVDFAPTVLSLADLAIPSFMQGRAFLGKHSQPPRRVVFGGKGRQGECFDTIRYVRDDRFQYNRNFHPEWPFGQYMSYLWQHPSMQAWDKLTLAGSLNEATSRFLAPSKPMEELYDVAADPWQIHNLATDPNHHADLERMRGELRSQMLAAGDLGLLPEREIHSRAEASTPWEMAVSPQLNPIDRLLTAASIANQRDEQQIPALIDLFQSDDSAIRWWGATGLVALGSRSESARGALLTAINDESPDVRIAAAEALWQIGETQQALTTLKQALSVPDVFARHSALRVISRLGHEAHPLIPAIQVAKLRDKQHKDVSDYIGRMVDYLPQQIGQTSNSPNGTAPEK